MQILALRIALTGPIQVDGFLLQKSARRLFVLVRLPHALLQHLADHARDACVVPGCVDAHPGGGLVIECDSEPFHLGLVPAWIIPLIWMSFSPLRVGASRSDGVVKSLPEKRQVSWRHRTRQLRKSSTLM